MAQAITASDFSSILEQSDKPVLIDFWATWCGPCRALGPKIDELAEEMKDKLNVYKCNVDEEPELAERFQIASIPTVILFKGTKVVHSLVGNMPKEELVSEIEAHL
jgi:thioredoxin